MILGKSMWEWIWSFSSHLRDQVVVSIRGASLDACFHVFGNESYDSWHIPSWLEKINK